MHCRRAGGWPGHEAGGWSTEKGARITLSAVIAGLEELAMLPAFLHMLLQAEAKNSLALRAREAAAAPSLAW